MQDICLYSESCKTLGRSSYRMSARRFLQELFLDLNLDSFYVEPQLIIAARKLPAEEKADSSTTSATTPTSLQPAVPQRMAAMKPKPKSLAQLASVYETSWENLLMDFSPRTGPTAAKSSSLDVPLPAPTQAIQNKLHIGETESSVSGSGSGSEDEETGEDVCDGSSVTTGHTALPTGGSNA